MKQSEKLRMYLEQMNRRQFLKYGAVAGTGALAGCTGGGGDGGSDGGSGGSDGGSGGSGGGGTPTPTPDPYSEQVSISIAAPTIAFPTEDPLGKTFTEEYNVDMQIKTVPATPSEMIKLFVAGNGQKQFDAIWDNGGAMEDLLGSRGALAEVDPSNIPNWGNRADVFKEGGYLYDTMLNGDTLYGVPSARNADTVAYVKDEIDEPDSWGVIFDDDLQGKTAVIDDYANTPHWTALYLRQNDRSDVHNADVLSDSQWDAINSIEGPQVGNLAPDQLEATIDYLIAQKQMGQFRTIWTSFGNVVNLLVNAEIVATYTYEPAVIAAKDQGAEVGYPPLKEGCFEWDDHWYMTSGAPGRNRAESFYRLATYSMTPNYGANLLATRGYDSGVSPDLIFEYMEENFEQDRFDAVSAEAELRQERYQANGDWHAWNNPNPDNLDLYLEEWNRFLSA